jgi:tetratricopeptide (TPR) repeat protein
MANFFPLHFTVMVSLILFGCGGSVSPRLAQGAYRSRLAHMDTKQGKYKEAEKLYSEALEEEQKSPSTEFGGRMHNGNLEACLANLAGCYATEGKFSLAEALYAQDIELLKKVYPDSGIFSERLIEIGKFYLHEGKLAQAETNFEKVLSMPQSSELGYSSKAMNGLANVYAGKGNNAKAELFYILTKIKQAFRGTNNGIFG